MEAKTNAQITAIHLLNNSNSIPLSPLNKSYVLKFANHCTDKSLNLPPAFNERQCPNCGILYIPGITCSIRIHFSKKSPTSKRTRPAANTVSKPKRSRTLRYKCLQCNHTAKIADLLVPQTPEKVSQTPFEAIWPPSANFPHASATQPLSSSSSRAGSRPGSQEPNSNTPTFAKGGSAHSAQADSKKKPKKRKQAHSLLNMMSKRKEEKEAPQKMSLNLMDFMK